MSTLLTGLAIAVVLFPSPVRSQELPPPTDSLAPIDLPEPDEVTAPVVSDHLAAVVNQEAITEREVLRELYYLAQTGRIPDPTAPDAREDLLDFWVGNRLMLQKAQAMGVPVSDTEVNEELERRLDAMSRQQGLLPGLYDQGYSISDIEKQIREEILAQRYQAIQESGLQLRPGDPVLLPGGSEASPQELRDYWLEHQDRFTVAEGVRATYVAISKASFWNAEDAMQFAYDLRVQLRSGRSVEAIRETGTIPESVQIVGGNLDWVTRDGDHQEQVVEAALVLEPGEWSPPIDQEERILLLRAEERRRPRVLPFEEVQEQIATAIEQERRTRRRRLLVHKLRETAYIWPIDDGGPRL